MDEAQVRKQAEELVAQMTLDEAAARIADRFRAMA